LIDRPEGGERAVLVHIYFPVDSMQEDLAEFKDLALSAGADAIAVVTGARKVPEPKYFVGTGKADEIRAIVLQHKADLVIFNHALSPAQERNLEKLFQCRVLDRVGLILDIFAQRARSFEGKLQVELALLKHLSTRLVRGWTHLERQRGGIGMRGPGETQLESDKRLIRKRIKFITERLTRVRAQREQGRRKRRKAIVPTVALVGYTNAGKSTLFNKITGADAYVANRLFATLDPTLRSVDLPELGSVILADTVGFIRHLPHDLVDAFHATLEEIGEASLLLHVVDAGDERRLENIKEVEKVLESIGAHEVPSIIVYNKIDLCQDLMPGVDRNADDAITRVRLSAQEGQGLTQLNSAMIELLGANVVEKTIHITSEDARLRAQLYQAGAVISEASCEDGSSELLVRMPRIKLEKLFE
jgi:GTP-binding protein HflX